MLPGLLSNSFQSHQPRDGTAPSELGLPTPIINQENFPVCGCVGGGGGEWVGRCGCAVSGLGGVCVGGWVDHFLH